MSREVSFSVSCADTRLGFHVRVVGSCKALGSWNPQSGIPLHTSALEFPAWRSLDVAFLEQEEAVEYKYVICDNVGQPVRWEERPNRGLDIAALAKRGVLPAHGSISVIETFNIWIESDDSRFQLQSSPSGATVHRCSSSRRFRSRDLSGLVAGVGEGNDNANSGLFAPTIRERMPSVSVLSDGAMRTAPSMSLVAGISLEAPQGGDESPAEAAVVGALEVAAGKGMAREESSSILFLGEDPAGENPPLQSEFDEAYSLVGQGPLGEGTFGLVWRCIPKTQQRDEDAQGQNGTKKPKERAAKIVRKARLQPRDMRNLLGEDGEVRTHLTMKHQHIVTLFEFFDEPHNVTLVLEYCAGGDLFDAVIRQHKARGWGGFSEQAAAIATRHTLSALAYMHSLVVVHRDIKCENVLLAEAGLEPEKNVYKLCDFGFAAHDRGEGLSDKLGSPDTVAPEVVAGTRYSTQADLWSVGVIIYMMLSATVPFFGGNDSEVLRKVQAGSYSLSGNVWTSISAQPKGLITSLMTVDPQQRPSAKEALDIDWLQA